MGTSIPASENPILAQMRRFSATYGKQLPVAGLQWRYYHLGDGPTVVWLTGGLRRAAFGFGFLQLLARTCTVLAPDYPVLRSFEQFDQDLSAILDTERIRRFHLAGQSYVVYWPILPGPPPTGSGSAGLVQHRTGRLRPRLAVACACRSQAIRLCLTGPSTLALWARRQNPGGSRLIERTECT